MSADLLPAHPPPVQPMSPSATFRALTKRAMRPRQERILFLSTVASYLLLAASLLSPRALWQPCVLLGTLCLVVCVVLPLLLMRRTHLIHSTPANELDRVPISRAAYARHILLAGDVWSSLGMHAVLGVFTVFIYASTAVCLQGTQKTALSPIRYVDVNQAYYVNETFLVTTASAACLGSLYAACSMLCFKGARRGVPPFDARHLGMPLYVHAMDALSSHIVRTLPVLCVWPVFFCVYAMVRDSFWTTVLRITGVDTVVRQAIVPSFRVPFHAWSMFASAVPVLVLMMVLMEVIHTLFDVYWTHPLPSIVSAYKDPITALLGGLTDNHTFFSTHAFAELTRLAKHDKAFRLAVYDDVQRLHGRPVAFPAISQACIRALDALAPAPEAKINSAAQQPLPSAKASGLATANPDAAAAAAAAAASKASRSPPPTSLSSSRFNIWQTLASRPASTSSSANTSNPDASSASSKPLTSAPPTSAPSAAFLGKSLAQTVWKWIPSEAKHVLFPHTIHAALFAPESTLLLDTTLYLDAPRACFAAMAMESMVLASLTEDKYGSVQHQVQGLVEALSRAHTRMERVRQSAESLAVHADSQHVRDMSVWRGALADAGSDAAATFGPAFAPFFTEMQMAWSAYMCLDSALSRATRRITETFAAFK